MPNFPPLVTPMVDLKTGIATPFWNKYFTQAFADASVTEDLPDLLPASSVLGRGDTGTGVAELLSLGAGLQMVGTVLRGVPASAGSVLWGRGASGSGDFEELTLGANLTLTGTVLSATSGGDVTGPASATDNALVRFDGTTGKLVQNSGASLSDAGKLSVTTLNVATFDVTVTAAATFGDYFNQSVKTTANVTFNKITSSNEIVATSQFFVGGTGGDTVLGIGVALSTGGSNLDFDIIGGIICNTVLTP